MRAQPATQLWRRGLASNRMRKPMPPAIGPVAAWQGARLPRSRCRHRCRTDATIQERAALPATLTSAAAQAMVHAQQPLHRVLRCREGSGTHRTQAQASGSLEECAQLRPPRHRAAVYSIPALFNLWPRHEHGRKARRTPGRSADPLGPSETALRARGTYRCKLHPKSLAALSAVAPAHMLQGEWQDGNCGASRRQSDTGEGVEHGM